MLFIEKDRPSELYNMPTENLRLEVSLDIPLYLAK